MTWDEMRGRAKIKNSWIVAAVVLILIIVFMSVWVNTRSSDTTVTASDASPKVTFEPSPGDFPAEGPPDEPTTSSTLPYSPPAIVTRAPVVAPVQSGGPGGPESLVATPGQLAALYTQEKSGLGSGDYTAVSDRATDIVASFLRGDNKTRYPNFFISFPTMRTYEIQYATAQSVKGQPTYIRGVVWWKGERNYGPALSQVQTAIYFKRSNLEPVNPVDLPNAIKDKDPAVNNTYVDAP